jgi:FkbM family methyltransferase
MIRAFSAIQFDILQIFKMAGKAANVSSFLRFATDLFLLRFARLLRLSSGGGEREIQLRGGVRLSYRLNRGDIESLREVWLDETYNLPFTPGAGVLIDLGANIGLTSVWLARHYEYSTIIAVEPLPENARLARLNLANNNIKAEVIEAAVGPTDGTVCFEEHETSNRGHVSSQGREVKMISMKSLLQKLPAGAQIDLVKMDIEGGEEALLRGNLDWLAPVRSLIAEFHPPVVDYQQAIKTLQGAGFRYIAAGSVHRYSMDAFVRQT